MTFGQMKEIISKGKPFTLHVADGRNLEVPHTDFVFLPPRSSVVYVATPSEHEPDETIARIIPLLMVSGVTMAQPAESLP